MSKFTFRLEAALRLKRLHLAAERSKFQELFARQKKLESALNALSAERTGATLFVQQAETPQSGDFRALSSFAISLDARAGTVREALMRCQSLIAEQKRRLLLAEQEERSIGKLRERQFAEWKQAEEREIEATAQELWVISHTIPTEDPDRCR